jgi:hypothetical protein
MTFIFELSAKHFTSEYTNSVQAIYLKQTFNFAAKLCSHGYSIREHSTEMRNIIMTGNSFPTASFCTLSIKKVVNRQTEKWDENFASGRRVFF